MSSNKYIIEVSKLSDIAKRSGESPYDHVYRALRARGAAFHVINEYDTEDIFVGVAVTIEDSDDLVALQAVSGIKSIRPALLFPRPQPVVEQNIDEFTTSQADFNGFSPHIMTGVDKVHAEKVYGKGVKIAIIDSGIDYNHPALGGGFGPKFKVVGGYDLVGDAYTGLNTPKPDNDPMDQCSGHGTHVAGIIGANPGTPYNIVGVAPSASLSAYRIFGCQGSTSEEVIISAMLMAVKDKHDVLNLSLGMPGGWSESTTAVVASQIVASGKVVTISAGNEGEAGAFYASNPAVGVGVISAASVDNIAIQLQSAIVKGATRSPIPYYSPLPLEVLNTLPIYVTSNDTTIVDDACDRLALEKRISNLSGYIAVMRRGNCRENQQIFNVYYLGAAAALIYDNGEGFTPINNDFLPVGAITATDGEWLVAKFRAGVPIKLSFPQTGGEIRLPNPKGNLVSPFSSYGPSNDLGFTPTIAGVGGLVFSTFSRELGGYKVLSGTSMAAPFIAGCAALVLESKGKSREVSRNMRTLLQSTSKQLASGRSDGLPQTIAQQGAGLVQVHNALHSTTTVDRAELLLNDTAHFDDVQTFTITNTGKSSKKYVLSHTPSGTAITVQPGAYVNNNGSVPLTSDTLNVRISPLSFTLRAGKSQQITARFSLPRNNNPKAYPVYSGFITASAGTDQVHTTYLGVGGALRDRPVLERSPSYYGTSIPTILLSFGGAMKDNHDFTFVNYDFPNLIWSIGVPTRVLRFDLVSPTFTLPKRDLDFDLSDNSAEGVRNGGGRGPHRPVFSFPKPRPGGSFEQVKIIGPLYEQTYLPRNTWMKGERVSAYPLSTPTFANGTKIPNGKYRILLRVLQAMGDPKRREDYDSWTSPVFGVKAI